MNAVVIMKMKITIDSVILSQVEFSYPPLIEGNSVESNEIPEEWKHLPSLALPDGAHNFVKGFVLIFCIIYDKSFIQLVHTNVTH